MSRRIRDTEGSVAPRHHLESNHRTLPGYKPCPRKGCNKLIPRGDELCILHEARELVRMFS